MHIGGDQTVRALWLTFRYHIMFILLSISINAVACIGIISELHIICATRTHIMHSKPYRPDQTRPDQPPIVATSHTHTHANEYELIVVSFRSRTHRCLIRVCIGKLLLFFIIAHFPLAIYTKSNTVIFIAQFRWLWLRVGSLPASKHSICLFACYRSPRLKWNRNMKMVSFRSGEHQTGTRANALDFLWPGPWRDVASIQWHFTEVDQVYFMRCGFQVPDHRPACQSITVETAWNSSKRILVIALIVLLQLLSLPIATKGN